MSLEDKLDELIDVSKQILAALQEGGENESGEEEKAEQEEEQEEEPAPAQKSRRGRPAKNKAATLDDARVVGKAFLEKCGSAELKKLLAKFKVKKLQDMAEDKFGEFIKQANAQMEGSDEEESEDEESEDEELV